jgi:hypothetical protein
MIRILSNSTLQPVVGADVSATSQPVYCGSVPATTQTTMQFITNGTTWYSFPTENYGGYSFTVDYSGQSYSLTTDLRPEAATCVTLIVPSGDTNVTNEYFQSSCASQTLANSTDVVCASTNYQELARVSTTVQNGTTETVTSTTTSTLGEDTYTTTTNTTETAGYVTTTETSNPPSSWTVVSCTYVSGNTSTTTSGSTQCPNNYPNGVNPPDAPTIDVQENSTAYLCVRFYYYNPNSTMTLNASDVFGIAGYEFNASTDFTISTSPGNLTLGGPQNLNEGETALYAIHANPNSNGTYNYGFQATYYPSLEVCNGLGEIVVGSGSPNYNVGFGSCTASQTSSLNPEGFANGTLYVEVVGVTNSTT